MNANNALVSASAKPFTLAHELVHILTNKGHFYALLRGDWPWVIAAALGALNVCGRMARRASWKLAVLLGVPGFSGFPLHCRGG